MGDVLSEKQASVILKNKKLWSEREDKLLDSLQDEMLAANQELARAEFKSNEKQKIITKIKGLKQRISRLERNKHSLRGTTQEDVLSEFRYRYYVFLLTENLAGERVWTDFEEFQKVSDKLIKKIVHATFTADELTEASIREVARNEPWRSIWVSAGKVGNLFSSAQSEMTDYQRILVSWSLIYDSAYESMEPPSDDIVDDDTRFDLWLENRSKERKAKRDKDQAEKVIQKSGKYSDVAIPVDSVEDAQRVYNLNDPTIKGRIASQQKFIQEKGEASELELPGVKRDLQMKANQIHMEKAKQRG